MSAAFDAPRPASKHHPNQTENAPEYTPDELASHLKTAVIVPAFNEAGRITNVLKVISQARLVDEIIVVTDGCEDTTADEARGFAARLAHGEVAAKAPLRVFELAQNLGKGGAMTYGAHRTQADVLLFLDADLIGLKAAQIDALLAPMLAREAQQRADMVLGLFTGARGGVVGWWLGLCHRKIAAITGQRAIRRDVFLAVPDLTRSRYGVETAITMYVRHVWKLNVRNVTLGDVTHPLKEEKFGVWRGACQRFGMYNHMAGYLVTDTLGRWSSAQQRRETLAMREHFNDKS